MTARQYAESVGFEVVGKLTKKSGTYTDYNRIDIKTGEYKVVKFAYWVDEAGNAYTGSKDSWTIATADGGVI